MALERTRHVNARGEILHDQARYWGQRGVHYHQFLAAGENTLNYQLAAAAVRTNPAARPLRRRRVAGVLHRLHAHLPGRHRDTYVEEYHREFFTNYARGRKPRVCGVADVHIGGLVPVPALFDALAATGEDVAAAVHEHVALTHKDPGVLRAADALVRILAAVRGGKPLRESILAHASDWISAAKCSTWNKEPDDVVIGRRLSPACYIPDAFPAALYLAWKYADDFGAGICANAQVGGDSCHRGAVVGALLGQANGVPAQWREGLVTRLELTATR